MKKTVAVLLGLAACGGSGGGTYVSVGDASLSLSLKGGGVAEMTAQGLGSTQGTYTVDGEKILVTVSGMTHTFIRDGNCISDQLSVFGKLCIGGEAGSARNVSTRQIPAPSGAWLASSSEGSFRIDFRGSDALTLTATQPGGTPDVAEGTYRVEEDMIYATLPQGMPLVLKYVNNAWETTSFGFALKFVKQ